MRKKLDSRKKIRIDGVFDIECVGWDEFLVGVTMTSGGETIVHHTADDMVDEMLYRGGHWWGHNSGKYDTLLVLEVLRRRGISQSISTSSSRVTRTMGGGLTIKDSYALIPMGLNAAAEMGGELKPSLWFDCHCGHSCGGYCSIYRGMPRYMLDRVAEYCVGDCRALIKTLRKLSDFADDNDIDLTGTIGGSSWATAKRTIGIPDATYSSSEWERLRQAYYGGRCTVFRPLNPSCVPAGSHYDISSAYPASLASTELPMGPHYERGKRAATAALASGTVGIYSCTIRVPGDNVPALPWAIGTGMSFPCGIVSGVWTSTEIAYAESIGCKVDDVHWGVVWNSSAVLFDDWIGNLYEKRIRHGKDSVWGKWLRLFANSLTGKLAERPYKRFLRMCPDLADIRLCDASPPCTLTSCCCDAWEQVDKWGEVWSVPFYKMSPSAHVHWAAFVTAATRIQQHAELVACDADYCDTDSCWTQHGAPAETGNGLGEWERKCGYLTFESVAPKHYAYTDEETGEFIICSAGAFLSVAEWTTGASVQDRGVKSIVDAARSGRGLFSRAHRRWTLPKHGEWYGDRRLGSDGRTYPVTCQELRERHERRSSGPHQKGK